MTDKGKKSCETDLGAGEQYEPIQPRIASGSAPVLVEIICERVHCVLYDYAISTVDMIVEMFGDMIDVQTVIRQGNRENAQHYLDICDRAGRMLPVPTILINGEVAFTSVPHPDEFSAAIRAVLIQKGLLKE